MKTGRLFQQHDTFFFRYHVTQWLTEGGGLGGSNPPRSSEDIGGVLDRMSKKNWHLHFLL